MDDCDAVGRAELPERAADDAVDAEPRALCGEAPRVVGAPDELGVGRAPEALLHRGRPDHLEPRRGGLARERLGDAPARELQLARGVERDDREPGRGGARGPRREREGDGERAEVRAHGGWWQAAPCGSSGMLAHVTHVVRVRFTVEPNYAGWRLDRYLQEKIQRLSRERVQHLIAYRLECEDGRRRLKPSTRVVAGLSFLLLRNAEPEPDAPLEFGVVHDDGALLVVDKPAGLPVHPTARYSANTFTSAARLRFPDRKIDPPTGSTARPPGCSPAAPRRSGPSG